MVTFTFFSLVFLAIGVVLYVMSDQITEIEMRYDSKCINELNKKCEVTFSIEEDINDTVYLYYQLDNFYQNHRRYVKSRDNAQLNGNYKTVDELSNCDPVIKVGDLWEYQQYNLNGEKMNLEDPATPCGLVAKSFFNDSFALSGPEGD